MTMDHRGRFVPGKLATYLENEIIKKKIDIASIDPFVKTHSVEENNNSAIDDVAQVLVDLSIKHNIAVDAPHHTSKGIGQPGNADRGRGASSMKDAGRLVYTLTPMSVEEAEKYGVPEELRRRLVRMDSGKVNIMPPLHLARWYELVGVLLGNVTELYPKGDNVQAIKQWFPPDTWEGLDDELINRILADIEAGTPDGNRYTDAANVEERGAWHVVVKHAPDKNEVQARNIIKTWVEKGTLLGKKYTNPVTRKKVRGLWVNTTKRKSAPDDELPF